MFCCMSVKCRFRKSGTPPPTSPQRLALVNFAVYCSARVSSWYPVLLLMLFTDEVFRVVGWSLETVVLTLPLSTLANDPCYVCWNTVLVHCACCLPLGRVEGDGAGWDDDPRHLHAGGLLRERDSPRQLRPQACGQQSVPFSRARHVSAGVQPQLCEGHYVLVFFVLSISAQPGPQPGPVKVVSL